jgi:hypothetical protein
MRLARANRSIYDLREGLTRTIEARAQANGTENAKQNARSLVQCITAPETSLSPQRQSRRAVRYLTDRAGT